MSKLSQISSRITQPLIDENKNIAMKKCDDFVVNRCCGAKITQIKK